jgi:hypothetical protein
MITFIDVCDIIDWDTVIEGIANRPPDYIGPKHKASDGLPGLDEVASMWSAAGYKTPANGGTVSWDMFFPGTSFPQSVVDRFAEYIGLQTPNSCWISRINPGLFAPIHWDVNDNEEYLSKQPDRPRWHCHISKPAFGHVFIAEDKCLYNQQQGSTYKWSSRKLWHAGTNCGLTPKYILNIW